MISVDISSPVAGVVVLYNPPATVLVNIRSYAHSLKVLFVIDNSDTDSGSLVNALGELGNVIYVRKSENVGVATALNLGAERAIHAGCEFLLMMDQDSCAQPAMVSRLLEAFACYGVESLGIAGAFPVIRFGETPLQHPEMTEQLDIITSGSLLNLAAYRKVGPFLEELFIDCVDVEYCLRLVQHGYKTVQVNTAHLLHCLGEPAEHRFLFVNYTTSNHSSLRRYYMTRNRFYVARLYHAAFPSFCRKKRRLIRREIPRVLLFETDRLNKLRMMLRGYLDYRAGRLGKYQEKQTPPSWWGK
ncbi:MAG: glycosyltransferase family 2 protein [Verrucomicrobiota bacterium]